MIDVLHSYGIEFPCGGKGTCGKCRVRIIGGQVQTDARHRARLDALGLGGDWRLACMSRCEADLVIEVEQYSSFILADETPFRFTPAEGMGVAVDVGTTTLVAQLVDRNTGEVMAVETAVNPQARFGSDLVSRLESAMTGHSGEMTRMIRETVNGMIDRMWKGRKGVPERIVLVGNTVMQHLFSGSDIRPLSFFPFESPHKDLKQFTSRELGWKVPCGEVLFYPSIGSFVGSDILAGIMATRMHESDGFCVLVDLGTNGEIVVGNRERMYCASTAAGPAFEGARISMGMLASTGAVSRVERKNNGWRCHVIGNTSPAGICGSGLIDAVAVLLDSGRLGEYGEILDGSGKVVITDPVTLTQRDIQEFQLAKAAVAAGLELLMKKNGAGEIGSVFLAGAFGSYINPSHVIRTGLLGFSEEMIRQLGNTALIGAKMFLFSDPGEIVPVLERITHVNLEAEPGFQDTFIDHMRFRTGDV